MRKASDAPVLLIHEQHRGGVASLQCMWVAPWVVPRRVFGHLIIMRDLSREKLQPLYEGARETNPWGMEYSQDHHNSPCEESCLSEPETRCQQLKAHVFRQQVQETKKECKRLACQQWVGKRWPKLCTCPLTRPIYACLQQPWEELHVNNDPHSQKKLPLGIVRRSACPSSGSTTRSI